MGLIPELQRWFNICKSINMIYHINKRKDKNHLILSIDAKKILGKVECQFLIKTLHRVVIDGTYLNIIEDIYNRPTANILNREHLRAFALYSGTRQVIVQSHHCYLT